VSKPDTELSKRERQKQRRGAKLAQERARLARARRNRLFAIAGVAVVALGAVGFVVNNQLSARQERAATIAAAESRLDDLGCTAIEEQADLGGGHLTDPGALAAAHPDVIYPDRPATSGSHLGSVVATGVYDKVIDERVIVHNLEHGYVTFWYDPDGDPEAIQALKGFGQEQIDGDYPKTIVAAHDALPDDASFAAVAWNFRQLCGEFDTDVATAFLAQHYNGEAAPERFLSPHLSSDSGVLDPDAQDGPLLFPPLGDDPADDLEEPEGSHESPDGEPPGESSDQG
jgi:hypothetical protein